ncbi:ATP-binding protein [Candidatus Contubernalis alkaliaceticus]|uniref:ATP-binding protein n=1 Tax=Candidatus Contubernalis alkaliaceticus TaxID=338645 RepID=UPI001F4BFEC9|nr:P-loop NTPase [Candidatus Contubernalis alkalaceticus]UNC93382.1 P-loop NTPase [Candidatus Contubernalis alkalaceticus]
MKIAVSGKGGVGKTTVAANLVKAFLNDGYNVYAVDADPDISLGQTLGFPSEELANLTPLVELNEVIDKKTTGGGGLFFDLNPDVDDVIENYSIAKDKVRLLRMGGIKQGGSACYCKENTFLNAVLNSLLFDKNDVVILDMSAGIEHLTRGTSDGVDTMIIVTEPTKVSVQTAKVVQKLAQDLGIRKIKVLGNKIRHSKEEEFIRAQFTEDELIGVLKFDEGVWETAMAEEKGVLAEEELLPNLEGVYKKILEEVKI